MLVQGVEQLLNLQAGLRIKKFKGSQAVSGALSNLKSKCLPSLQKACLLFFLFSFDDNLQC